MNGEVRGLFEKHLQTFLLGLLSLLVIWFGRTTIETEKTVIKIQGDIRALEASVSAKMLDRYTGTEAESHKALQALEHRYFENSIQEHTNQIEEIEEKLNGGNKQ